MLDCITHDYFILDNNLISMPLKAKQPRHTVDSAWHNLSHCMHTYLQAVHWLPAMILTAVCQLHATEHTKMKMQHHHQQHIDKQLQPQ